MEAFRWALCVLLGAPSALLLLLNYLSLLFARQWMSYPGIGKILAWNPRVDSAGILRAVPLAEVPPRSGIVPRLRRGEFPNVPVESGLSVGS